MRLPMKPAVAVVNGCQVEQGTSIIPNDTSNHVISLPFTPTKFFFINNDGTNASEGYYDKSQNINTTITRIASGSAISYDQIIVGEGQVTINYLTTNAKGDTRYYIAINDE